MSVCQHFVDEKIKALKYSIIQEWGGDYKIKVTQLKVVKIDMPGMDSHMAEKHGSSVSNWDQVSGEQRKAK